MRTSLIMAVLLLCSCNGAAFADNAPASAPVQGNQGYVQGAPKADAPATSTDTTQADDQSHPIGSILNAIWRLDAWVQKNMW